jgi:hypothetical protein
MKVTPVLGYISVEGGTLEEAKPANNATRWIFTVEGALQRDGCLVVTLLEPRNKKPIKPDIVSCSLLPLTGDFYEARPFILPLAEGEPGTIALKHAGTQFLGPPNEQGPTTVQAIPPCTYRVQVDIMHTATR